MRIQLYKIFEDEVMISNATLFSALQEATGRVVCNHVLRHRNERVPTQKAGLDFHILMPEQIAKLKAAFHALHISDAIIEGLLDENLFNR